MKSTKFTFHNNDGIELAAKLDMPDGGTPLLYALFAHCFTCAKNLTAVRRISRGLTAAGIGVLRFDFTGLGESEGEFAETGFSSQTSDLVSAARFLEHQVGSGPAILVGHSLGGTAALYAAREIPGVRGVATIGSPSDPSHVTKLFQTEVGTIETQGEAEVSIGGRPFCIKRSFLDDLRDYPPDQWLHDLQVSTLIMHSPQDNVVSIHNAERIFRAVPHPRSFVSLYGADHLLSNAEHGSYVADMVGAWARQFVEAHAADAKQNASSGAAGGEPAGQSAPQPAAQPAKAGQDDEAGPPAPQPAEGYTMVAEIGTEPYTVHMSNGRHELVGDEPESVGGGDRGGNPFVYLLAALGSCTAMTMRMYADRKGWDLAHATVNLRHKKVKPEEIDVDPETTTAKQADHIEIQIGLEGELSEQERDRLIQIAHHCPVHRTLTSPTKIDVQQIHPEKGNSAE